MRGRSTRVMFVTVCACAAALAALGCGGGGGGGKGASVRTSAAVRNVTNIPEVDQLIAVASGADVIGLAGLTGYDRVPCGIRAAGVPALPGDPPACRTTEQAGDAVEVLASSACEGGWVRPEDAPDAYRAALNGAPQLFAVYVPKTRPGAFGADLGAQYVIVLSAGTRNDGKPAGVALHVNAGRIVWLETECEQFLALVSQDVVASFIVGPITGAPQAAASPGVTVVPAP